MKESVAMTIVDNILMLFARRGAAAYHGERVSQTEHALQAAALAVSEGAPDHLIVAALLHDVGHLLDGQDENLATRGLDGQHEELGCAWLTTHFEPEVTEPIRLHVAAKRYLCAVDPSYLASLSPSSCLSLSLQGGLMNPGECLQFESNLHFQDAVRLRRWDDTAKVQGLIVSCLEEYRERLEAMVKTERTS
jgi:phosphonate degradation associated HDIG domain protein